MKTTSRPRKQRRIMKGLCATCGKRQAIQGRRECRQCRKHDRDWDYMHRLGKQITAHSLRRIRIAKGMSQGDVAERAGLARESVNRLEHCLFDPTITVMRMIAKALDVRVGDLVDAKAARVKVSNLID